MSLTYSELITSSYYSADVIYWQFTNYHNFNRFLQQGNLYTICSAYFQVSKCNKGSILTERVLILAFHNII